MYCFNTNLSSGGGWGDFQVIFYALGIWACRPRPSGGPAGGRDKIFPWVGAPLRFARSLAPTHGKIFHVSLDRGTVGVLLS